MTPPSLQFFNAGCMRVQKFKRSMLDYSKFILSKMFFDRKLFRKELKKAFQYLSADERRELIRWVRSPDRLLT
jgi:alpha-N-acetylglucosamine transferase